jgi:hypothetical protein
MLRLLRYITILLCSFVFFNCVPEYFQIYDINSPNCKRMNEYLTTENDSIRLVYAFWAENGKMRVFIHNKSDKPLYIDWKKCSFMVEDSKNDYWQDVTTTNSSGSSSSSGSSDYWLSNFLKSMQGFSKSLKGESTWQTETFFSSTSVMIKPERITFIPPHATICRSDFSIINNDIMFKPTFKKDTTLTYVYHDADLHQRTRIVTDIIEMATFSESNSPLRFSSFITYSSDESFKTESYIDKIFYIEKISRMSHDIFMGKPANTADEVIENIWAKPSSFYGRTTN